MPIVLRSLLLFALGFVAVPVQAAADFALETADGKTLSGALLQIEDDWSIRLDGNPPARVAGGDVVSLRCIKTPLPGYPAGECVLFANGDRLAGNWEGLNGDQLRLMPTLDPQKAWSLPLSSVAILWRAAPAGVDQSERFKRRLLAEKRARDVVYLVNGDRLEGTLSALNASEATLEIDNKEVKAPRDKLAALAFSTELMQARRPAALCGRLVLRDGSRLTVTSVRGDGQTLQGKTAFGEAVAIPVKELVALDLQQGRAVYLSDLKPLRYKATPFLDLTWPYVLDGSVAGQELRLGGGTYDKGLGMHSASRLTFALAGGYRRFESWVGLDDQTGRQGQVGIQILVDGKPQALGWDGDLTWRGGPRRLRVELHGAKELTLVVRFRQSGRGPDAHDHLNWGDARLIR